MWQQCQGLAQHAQLVEGVLESLSVDFMPRCVYKYLLVPSFMKVKEPVLPYLYIPVFPAQNLFGVPH
jgi:hypothetical protein